MAVIFSLVGGVIGFVVAIVSLVFLDSGIAVAFGMWSITGLAVLVIGLGLGMLGNAPVKNRTSIASPRAYRP